MPYKDSETGRKKELERHHRRTADRCAIGMCPKRGKNPPTPGRSLYEACLERGRESERVRYARRKAEGMLYGGRVRAEHVGDVKRSTMRDFLDANVEAGSTLYTDDTATARGIPDLFNRLNHESVNHSVGEYVRGQAHTNGVESFWSMLKRGYQGTYHQMSAKHLQRYITEFAGRHNVRDLDTLEQMLAIARGMCGRALPWKILTA